MFNNVPLLNVAGDLGDRLVFINSVSVLDLPDGDYDFDGDVDGNDFLIWQKSLGSTTDAAADGNGNGVVDGADRTIWETDLSAAIAAASIATIPEPTSIGLAMLGTLFVLKIRRR